MAQIDTITLPSIFYNMIMPNSAAGAVFILLVLGFRQITKRWSKGYVRVLWILLLAGMMAPPLIHGSFYTIRNVGMETAAENNPWKPETQTPQKSTLWETKQLQAQETARTSQNDTGIPQQPLSAAPAAESSPAAGSVSSRFSSQKDITKSLQAWCVRLWSVGTLILLLFYTVQFLILKKKMKGAAAIPGQEYLETDQTQIPFVMPGFPPQIYLPEGLSDEQKGDILAHEKQHVKNLDPLWKCLAMTVSAVYWFHPLVWAAVSLMGKDMEMYCDECVLRGKSMAQRRAYSGTLLEFAAKSNGLTVTMNFGQSNAGRRIRHILSVKKPRLAVSLSMVLFVGISGVLFLTSKNVEGKSAQQAIEKTVKETKASKTETSKTETSKTEAESSGQTDSRAFRYDPEKFADRIIKLVKTENKEQLADLVNYPIRVDIDGEQTYLEQAEDFVNYYDQIATKKWKAGILSDDGADMVSNYMGYGMAKGKLWFSQIIGREGYWIYAVNNSEESHYIENTDIQQAWETLAQEQGMTSEQAQKWYVRFQQDELAIDRYNEKITGCAYEDFDENGVKDLFIVTSIGSSDIYPEYITNTMYVYGYLNEQLVYQNGWEQFSKDGFLQCAGRKIVQDDGEIHCRVSFTVDTDSLEEQQYVLDFDSRGNLISEQRPGESDKIIQMLAKVPAKDYETAVSFAKNSSQIFQRDHIVLFDEDKNTGIKIYGYESRKYGARGMVLEHHGNRSYYDYTWDRTQGMPYLSVQDFDGDGQMEPALKLLFGHGTGISVDQLILFKEQGDGAFSDYKLGVEWMQEYLPQMIQLDQENERIAVSDGIKEKYIDLKIYPDYEKGQASISCWDQISFDISGDSIKMIVKIGALFRPNEVTYTYTEGDEDTVTFEVLFQEGEFQLRLQPEITSKQYSGAGITFNHPGDLNAENISGEDGSRMEFKDKNGKPVFWYEQGENWRIDMNLAQSAYEKLLEEKFGSVQINAYELINVNGISMRKAVFQQTGGNKNQNITEYLMVSQYAYFDFYFIDCEETFTESLVRSIQLIND